MTSSLVGLGVALVALVPAGPSARGRSCSLDELVDSADLICIGRVEEVVVVDLPEPIPWAGSHAPIARVAVERVLKGPASTTVVHQEAWGIGRCDLTRSSTEVGDRALLFLTRQGEIAKNPESVRSAVRYAIGSDDIFRNWQSPNGIVTILDEGGVEYVGSPMSALRVPGEERHIARLSDVVRYVEDLSRFPRESVSVLARSKQESSYREPTGSFDLRILPSGEARLATDLGYAEQVRTFRLDPSVWRSLEQELATLVGSEDRSVGEAKPFPTRELVLRNGDATLIFAQPREWAPPEAADPSQRFALEDALLAWTLVRDLAELPELDPHAEKDRRWLASGR